MTRTIYQIPSYGRQDKPLTVDLLCSYGIPKEDIWVGVDDEAQRVLYEYAVGDRAKVICCDSVNCAQARYHMLSMVEPGTRVITLDDDIRAFSVYKDEKTLEPLDGPGFREALDDAFSFALGHNARVWGGYPVVNPYFMSRTIDLRNVTLATFMGLVASDDLQFNPEWTVKEDYELCLREMKEGRNCVRYNFLVAEATHWTPGGAMRYWETGKDEEFTDRLCKEFPQFVVPSKNKAGFKFVGAVRHTVNGPKKGRRC